jgi:hypothetical protein
LNVILTLIAVVVALAAALLLLLFVFTRHTVRKIEAGLPPTGRFVDVSVGPAGQLRLRDGRAAGARFPRGGR